MVPIVECQYQMKFVAELLSMLNGVMTVVNSTIVAETTKEDLPLHQECLTTKDGDKDSGLGTRNLDHLQVSN